MNTELKRAIVVNLANGDAITFNECTDGLYYYDLSQHNKNSSNPTNNYSSFQSTKFLINSVAKNVKIYTKK